MRAIRVLLGQFRGRRGDDQATSLAIDQSAHDGGKTVGVAGFEQQAGPALVDQFRQIPPIRLPRTASP